MSFDSFLKKSPFELSGGEKRRVAIAGVLAMNPEVLILDEPTAGLDPKGRDKILNQLKKLQTERNIAIVLVSHSMEDVAKYASRLIVMKGGSVFCDGTPKEVFEEYKELEKIGLAAPQVGMLRRVVVIDIGEGVIELVNPQIIAFSGEQEGLEGCLSFPGEWGITIRPDYVMVNAQDREGNLITVEGRELLAKAFCHEIDHLNGTLYVDKMDREILPGDPEYGSSDEDEEEEE